ncbi:malate dehydrogenase [Cutibacterium acnes JCM 18909]|nr:malate dehydrogenase [Cutibacterium acnes JCM 18909]
MGEVILDTNKSPGQLRIVTASSFKIAKCHRGLSRRDP